MTIRKCLLLVVCLHFAGLAAAQQNGDDYSMQDIARAAEERWKDNRSGRVEWTEVKWLHVPTPSTDKGEEQGAEASDTLELSNRFDFEGDKYRFTRRGPTWNEMQHKYTDAEHLGVWNGKVGYVLRHDLGFPHGEIYDRGWDLTQKPLRPLGLAMRFLHPQWGTIDLSGFVIASHREVIDGFECIALETSPQTLREKNAKGRKPLKQTYWISPQQQFAVVRTTLSMPDRPRPLEEITITYTHSAADGWRPSRWKLVDGSNEQPDDIIEGVVTKFERNAKSDVAQFEFEFPEGVWARDSRLKKDESFIVRANGEKRPVTRAELVRGATYEDILATNTGEAATARRQPSRSTWLIWGTLAAVVLLAARYAWRR